jgi:hypothetical protein
MYADGSACGCTGILRCVRAGGVPAVECVVDENNPIEGQIVGPDECPVDRRNSVQPEQCDELDNDCDGRIDENFAVMEDPENCGRCGNRCDAATPFCSAGQCAQCDSVDQRGCNELGPAPICVAGLCVPCQNDAACAARPGARNRCDVPSGRCVE